MFNPRKLRQRKKIIYVFVTIIHKKIFLFLSMIYLIFLNINIFYIFNYLYYNYFI